MNLRISVAPGAIALGALLVLAAPARAGNFVAVAGCELLSQDPPRFRTDFGFVDTHLFGPLCQVRIEPTSFNGSTLWPALACTAPPALSCAVDSAGVAVFTANPCLDQWLIWNCSITTAGYPASFWARLIGPNGAVEQVNLETFDCAAPTPAARRSWGSLKLLYR